jgi:hypothetical protein
MVKQFFSKKAADKVLLVEDVERGYHSNTDPFMDEQSADMYEMVIQDHLIRRGCWIPSRFKKFPRFTIFTQKD